mgnify:FL=1
MALTKVTGQGLETLSDGVTITVDDNSDTLTIKSTDTDANEGPILKLLRDGDSAADNDLIGVIKFNAARDDNNADISYGKVLMSLRDASDGSEDGTFQIVHRLAGSDAVALEIDNDEYVFNNGSNDVDFRVESNNSANMLFVDAGNDEVVIQRASSGATATSGSVLIVEDDDNTEISILGGSSSVLALNFGHSGDADDGKIDYNTTSGSEEMRFFVNAAERMSIDKDGNFLIGDLQEQTHGGRISQTVVSGDSGISIMSRSATDSHQPEITLMKTPATSGNYTATADGEALGSIKFRGVNTSAVSDIGAQIRAVQNGTESGTVPANLIFSTNETDRLTIAANGTASFSASVVAETDTDTSNTGSVTLNFAEHQNFVLTFTGNVTLANPTTETVGQSGFIACIQDGTGSRTLSLGTDYETAGGAGITLSTAASATDLIPYVVIAANRILLGTPQLAFS